MDMFHQGSNVQKGMTEKTEVLAKNSPLIGGNLPSPCDTCQPPIGTSGESRTHDTDPIA